MRETLGQIVNGMAAQTVVVTLICAIGWLSVARTVGPVEAVVSIGLLLRFTQILVDIGALASAFETRRPVLDLSHEILSAPELPTPDGRRSTDEAWASSDASVSFENVSFSYEADHPVLQGVSYRRPLGLRKDHHRAPHRTLLRRGCGQRQRARHRRARLGDR